MAHNKKPLLSLLAFCLLASFLNAEGQGDGQAQAVAQTQGSLDQGRAMSQDATAEMDRAFANQSAGTQSASNAPNAQSAQSANSGGAQVPTTAVAVAGGAPGVPPPDITKDKNGKPNWVDMPDKAYNRQYYISAVGYATSRPAAEAKAFGNLTALFGQSVTSNFSAVEVLKERINDGLVSVQSGQDIESAVGRSSSMNQLIGAEIGDRWEDKSTKPVGHYAVAFMEIPKTIKIYAELIDANDALIAKAVAAAAGNTFDAIARYQLAASLADANAVFSTVVSLVGGGAKKSAAKSGDDYRYEANNIAKKIPVNVVVKTDNGGRMKAAFADVFTKAGFRTGSATSRYVLDVSFKISPVELPNANKFSRFEIVAELKDATDNTVLMPYSVNGREGHPSQSEADQRALRAAESKIKEEFAEQFNAYLTEALPKK